MPRRFARSVRLRQLLTASSIGVALSCAACATPRVADTTRPGLSEGRASQLGTTSHLEAGPSESPGFIASTGVARLGGRTATNDNNIQQVAFAEGTAPNCPPDAILRCPPEPRYPVAGDNPWAVGMPFFDAACQPSPHRYPDEYLCDGGDRDWPVHYGEDQRFGLDTEDTVAEFTDHRGKERIAKSNRVCVYAPRFAAVRTVSLPHEEGGYQELAQTENTDLGGEMRTRLAPNLGNKNVALNAMQMRSRASGVASDVIQSDMQQRQRPHIADKVLNTFQDLNFFQSGTLDQSDVAYLNLGIRAALVWSREQSPVIQGKIETPITGLAEIHSSTLTVIDDKKSHRPGQLRMVKVADKDTAQPGDVITFTIRYDNLGPREVQQVRIVDNLTPRLMYVDDSATSDRTGRLVVEDNGEGSLVLTWELTDPLLPLTGGVVTFQAQVR